MAGLLVAAIAGCGGGSSDPTVVETPPVVTPPVTTPVVLVTGTPVVVASNATPSTDAAAAAWKALTPAISNVAVTINSPPVVTFSVTDAAGKPLSGLANVINRTGQLPYLANFGFTLAKLVPAANGAPSKWVSYLVTKPVLGTDGKFASWAGTYPTYDKEGTLVENATAPGNYTYTFYRDVKSAKSIVDGLADSTNKAKADLGDLTWEPKLPHRLGIQLSGTAPGTGTNTPDYSTSSVAAVNMTTPTNAVYNFIPETGAAIAAADSTRDIVSIDTCAACHQGKAIGHGTSRKNPQYCVTCHTDQTKYGFAPVTATATTVSGTYGRIAETDGTTSAAFTYPRMIHQLHMGNKLVKTGYDLNGGCAKGENQFCLDKNKLPQDIRNCTTCHDGSATAKVKTTNGDNWKNNPSALACGACHDGIDFKAAGGAGFTLADIKNKVTTPSGHGGGQRTDDSTCVVCHTADANVVSHSNTYNKQLNSSGVTYGNFDATKRTMTAAISGVVVNPDDGSATAGNVTVSFKILDNGVEVTDKAAISGLAFSLAKLNAKTDTAATNWQSYTGKARTSDAALPPVVQGYNETANMTNVAVDPVTHVWTYKFTLENDTSTFGNIRNITIVKNKSTITTGSWTPALYSTLLKGVAYEPALTHRVAMEFSSATGDKLPNKFNAIYDWVPAGGTAQTRNIVTMANCATCHAGSKIHKGYSTEYCVTCHNANTSDPYTGTFAADGVTPSGVGSRLVDFQVIVHKLHSGEELPSVVAGGTYAIGHNDYSKSKFPGVITNCKVCHNENAVKADGVTKLENAANWRTAPSKVACSTCHDAPRKKDNGTVFDAPGHINGMFSIGGNLGCVACHQSGSTLGVAIDVVHTK